jgi:hypothetical protein
MLWVFITTSLKSTDFVAIKKLVIKVPKQKVVAICVNSVWLRVDTQFLSFLFSTHRLSRRSWHNASIEKNWIADRAGPFNSNPVISKSYVVGWSNLYFKFTIGAVCSLHRCLLYPKYYSNLINIILKIKDDIQAWKVFETNQHLNWLPQR